MFALSSATSDYGTSARAVSRCTLLIVLDRSGGNESSMLPLIAMLGSVGYASVWPGKMCLVLGTYWLAWRGEHAD